MHIRKGRGRGPGRKRGQGAQQRSTADYLEKRQRRHEGWWQEGWAGGWDDNNAAWDWKGDDDDAWGEWECLGCDTVHLFGRFSLYVVNV